LASSDSALSGSFSASQNSPVKLVTFEDKHHDQHPGVLLGEDVVRLPYDDMRSLFDASEDEFHSALEADGPAVSLHDVRLRAPIAPKKLIHTSGNFAEHEEEFQNAGFNFKLRNVVYLQNVDAIIGPEDGIVYPDHLTQELDYELELAMVIRKAGKDFGPEDAQDYIGGYLIFNDITARDIQREELESGCFGFCKAIDTFCPIGPWIVTPDEVGDVRDLPMELRVNGDVRQSSNSGRMRTTLEDILANYSPLGYSAGDVVTTGTVAGVAGFRTDGQNYYLRPGDVVECEIGGIGVLRNTVVERVNAEKSGESR
jgi:2-keto-4-pentenoate hydratase/2-oxohepta-3-ene-1,7-dioic acid hydratase in catechol pathway